MFNIEKYKEIQQLLEKNVIKTDIIAVSKNHSQQSVVQAIELGVNIFGENRVQEAKLKFENLKITHPNIELHLTGPLQSNKVKQALELFDVFHTLDREKIAREFSKHAELIMNKKIFIQVNTGLEETKSGIAPKHLYDFVKFCENDLNISICGLMCIPPFDENPKNHFQLLQNLSDEMGLKELSIGMSNDYEDALSFKPRYIRLGTILFGKRI